MCGEVQKSSVKYVAGVLGGKDGKVKKERYKNKKDKSGTSHIQETIWTNRKVGNTWTPP